VSSFARRSAGSLSGSSGQVAGPSHCGRRPELSAVDVQRSSPRKTKTAKRVASAAWPTSTCCGNVMTTTFDRKVDLSFGSAVRRHAASFAMGRRSAIRVTPCPGPGPRRGEKHDQCSDVRTVPWRLGTGSHRLGVAMTLGTTSFSICPRCRLSVRSRAECLRVEYCPRCIAHAHIPVRLFSSALSATELYSPHSIETARRRLAALRSLAVQLNRCV